MSMPLDSSPTCYAIDDLTVDFAKRSVDRGGERIPRNTLSCELLRTLGQVVDFEAVGWVLSGLELFGGIGR